MNGADEYAVRIIDGVTLIGPDIFQENRPRKSVNAIASAFPDYNLIVATPGIHATQGCVAEAYVLNQTAGEDPARKKEAMGKISRNIYKNAAALLVIGFDVIIRTNPKRMNNVFAADRLLQRFLPKKRIKFTGAHLSEIRESLRNRGEIWRISVMPSTPYMVKKFIQRRVVPVQTENVYYINHHTGERFLTYEKFMELFPVLASDPDAALPRLAEIVRLSQMTNHLGNSELRFFVKKGEAPDITPLENLVGLLERRDSSDDPENAAALFQQFAETFRRAAGDLAADNPTNMIWRTAMFCNLSGLNEREIEEKALGMAPEFYLNILWLPGVRLKKGRPVFEPDVEDRVRRLIEHFINTAHHLLAVNIGRVESPLTVRDCTDQRREVFVAALSDKDAGVKIRIARMAKWDVIHRIRQGKPYEWAVSETAAYRNYISDRLRAIRSLEIAIPEFTEVEITDHAPGVGEYPAYFFIRDYYHGATTDKLPAGWYGRPGFIRRLAALLGKAAAASMVIGRVCARNHYLFFDDGDELIQLDSECGLPENLIFVETTGSFTDCRTALHRYLPQCLARLDRHIGRTREQRPDWRDDGTVRDIFIESLVAEVVRMQNLLAAHASELRSLFNDRPLAAGGIRSRWNLTLDRLAAADPDRFWEDYRREVPADG